MKRYRLERVTGGCDIRRLYPLLEVQYLSERSEADDASFERWLFGMAENRWTDFFLIVSGSSSVIEGCAYAEAIRTHNANCFIHVLLPDVEGRSAVTAQMADYMFCQYPLNKLFMPVEDDFAPPGFTCEAVLKDYLFRDGRYRDLSIWGLGRKDKAKMPPYEEQP